MYNVAIGQHLIQDYFSKLFIRLFIFFFKFVPWFQVTDIIVSLVNNLDFTLLYLIVEYIDRNSDQQLVMLITQKLSG